MESNLHAHQTNTLNSHLETSSRCHLSLCHSVFHLLNALPCFLFICFTGKHAHERFSTVIYMRRLPWLTCPSLFLIKCHGSDMKRRRRAANLNFPPIWFQSISSLPTDQRQTDDEGRRSVHFTGLKQQWNSDAWMFQELWVAPFRVQCRRSIALLLLRLRLRLHLSSFPIDLQRLDCCTLGGETEAEGWRRASSLERAVESVLSVKKEKNLCHQTLSLSHANTREINFAWKI